MIYKTEDEIKDTSKSYIPLRFNVDNLNLDEKSSLNKLLLDDIAFFNQTLKLLFVET